MKTRVNFLGIIKRKGIVESFYLGLVYYLNLFLLAKIKTLWLRFRGYDIDFSVSLHGENRFFQSHKNSIKIGKYCEIGYGVSLSAGFSGSINIEEGTSVCDGTMIDVHKNLQIGKDTMIAPFCYLCDYDHGFGSINIPIKNQGYTAQAITIDANVWIGARCIILKGVHIGRGAIIGAGSVVTRDIPEYCVAAGIPAKVKRIRK